MQWRVHERNARVEILAVQRCCRTVRYRQYRNGRVESGRVERFELRAIFSHGRLLASLLASPSSTESADVVRWRATAGWSKRSTRWHSQPWLPSCLTLLLVVRCNRGVQPKAGGHRRVANSRRRLVRAKRKSEWGREAHRRARALQQPHASPCSHPTSEPYQHSRTTPDVCVGDFFSPFPVRADWSAGPHADEVPSAGAWRKRRGLHTGGGNTGAENANANACVRSGLGWS